MSCAATGTGVSSKPSVPAVLKQHVFMRKYSLCPRILIATCVVKGMVIPRLSPWDRGTWQPKLLTA